MAGEEQPIHSSRADDPELGDALDAFVVGLAERIDALQDADRKGELAALATLAGVLVGEGEGYGFASLSLCAARIRSACGDGKPDDAHHALVELTEIARRIRLGHRGAV